MCKICDAKRVVLIGSIAALGQSLAQTAAILDSINATNEKKVVLGRLKEVFDLDPTTVELDEAGSLQAKEEEPSATGEGHPLFSLLDQIFGVKPREEVAQNTEEAAPAKSSGLPDAALAKALAELMSKLKGNADVSVEHHMVAPRGASPEAIEKQRQELAEMLGVAVDQIKVV